MKKFCIICGKEFKTYHRNRRGRKPLNVRPFNCKTCSKICSQINNRNHGNGIH